MYIRVADQPALLPDTTPPGVYRPGGTSSLQRLFRLYFPQITARYETDFAKGGFDLQGRFVHVPSLDAAKLAQVFRTIMVSLFLRRQLISERLARNMLDWSHSGFSVDGSVRVPATSAKTRVSLAEYIARPPVSLQKMLVEEGGSSVLYRSEYNPFFKTNARLFPAVEFLVQLLQHLPDSRTRLIRRYGLYSSRSRGTWARKPHLVRLAPEGWRREHGQPSAVHLDDPVEPSEESVSARESRAAWARLLAKVYEVDVLRCPRCGSTMKVFAVITDPQQVRRVLRHLIKTGASPPGLDPASLA